MTLRRVMLPGLALAAAVAGYGAAAVPMPPLVVDAAGPTPESVPSVRPTLPVLPPALAPKVAPSPSAAPAPRRQATRAVQSAKPILTVRYRVEVRAGGEAARSFPDVVNRTLSDPRGWRRARFHLVADSSATYTVILAEAAEVDRLCLPYDTFGKYSCQNGPVVAINADRWRSATPKWTGDLATYRQMLVNHEVGHLLGQHHPAAPQCAVPGRPALLMSQQSTELDGCLPNPWPRGEEIARAAQHVEPLAPPYAD